MAGLDCPKCGMKTRVVDSRAHQKGIRRRRSCPNEHRFSSIEMIETRVSIAPKRPKSEKINLLSLPLTYLRADQKKRAKKFFAAGWTLSEVAPLFDMKPADLRK